MSLSTENSDKKNGTCRKLSQVPARDWIILAVLLALYILFLIWIRGWWGFLAVPFIFDVYVTKFINWGWWKQIKNGFLRSVMSWVDAIVFALVAVYFVNLYLFQNYTIPSSSLEKSLLVGDYLYVSKVAYGPRKPMTPLTMPLTNNTLPGGGKSYFEKPQWKYERVKGFGTIKQNDIVVFNYPSGDTIVANPKYQAMDYYAMVYSYGKNMCNEICMDSLSAMQQRRVYGIFYTIGRDVIVQHKGTFGAIGSRPVDRRENYVKRCVGLPGQTLQIVAGDIYIDGALTKQPDNVQFNYIVKLVNPISASLRDELGISKEDLPDSLNVPGVVFMPLTDKSVSILKAHPEVASYVGRAQQDDGMQMFPQNKYTKWTVDDYGPIWIPKKGETVQLNLDNLPLYERIIDVYEGNDLEVTSNGHILINGVETDSYTFAMDYYWMMGDNRHNSADSRYWGFVPEDHIVGKPVLVWLSLNPDKHFGQKGKIRWNRMFTLVRKYS